MRYATAAAFRFRPVRYVRRALQETFDARRTHPFPVTLPPPPADWRPGYRRMATEVGIAPDLSLGYEQVRSFLDPLLNGSVSNDGRWDPVRRTW